MYCRSECYLPVSSRPQGPTPTPPQFGGSHHVQPGLLIESVKDGEEITITVSKQASRYP